MAVEIDVLETEELQWGDASISNWVLSNDALANVSLGDSGDSLIITGTGIGDGLLTVSTSAGVFEEELIVSAAEAITEALSLTVRLGSGLAEISWVDTERGFSHRGRVRPGVLDDGGTDWEDPKEVDPQESSVIFVGLAPQANFVAEITPYSEAVDGSPTYIAFRTLAANVEVGQNVVYYGGEIPPDGCPSPTIGDYGAYVVASDGRTWRKSRGVFDPSSLVGADGVVWRERITPSSFRAHRVYNANLVGRGDNSASLVRIPITGVDDPFYVGWLGLDAEGTSGTFGQVTLAVTGGSDSDWTQQANRKRLPGEWERRLGASLAFRGREFTLGVVPEGGGFRWDYYYRWIPQMTTEEVQYVADSLQPVYKWQYRWAEGAVDGVADSEFNDWVDVPGGEAARSVDIPRSRLVTTELYRDRDDFTGNLSWRRVPNVVIKDVEVYTIQVQVTGDGGNTPWRGTFTGRGLLDNLPVRTEGTNTSPGTTSELWLNSPSYEAHWELAKTSNNELLIRAVATNPRFPNIIRVRAKVDEGVQIDNFDPSKDYAFEVRPVVGYRSGSTQQGSTYPRSTPMTAVRIGRTRAVINSGIPYEGQLQLSTRVPGDLFRTATDLLVNQYRTATPSLQWSGLLAASGVVAFYDSNQRCKGNPSGPWVVDAVPTDNQPRIFPMDLPDNACPPADLGNPGNYIKSPSGREWVKGSGLWQDLVGDNFFGIEWHGVSLGLWQANLVNIIQNPVLGIEDLRARTLPPHLIEGPNRLAYIRRMYIKPQTNPRQRTLFIALDDDYGGGGSGREIRFSQQVFENIRFCLRIYGDTDENHWYKFRIRQWMDDANPYEFLPDNDDNLQAFIQHIRNYAYQAPDGWILGFELLMVDETRRCPDRYENGTNIENPWVPIGNQDPSAPVEVNDPQDVFLSEGHSFIRVVEFLQGSVRVATATVRITRRIRTTTQGEVEFGSYIRLVQPETDAGVVISVSSEAAFSDRRIDLFFKGTIASLDVFTTREEFISPSIPDTPLATIDCLEADPYRAGRENNAYVDYRVRGRGDLIDSFAYVAYIGSDIYRTGLVDGQLRRFQIDKMADRQRIRVCLVGRNAQGSIVTNRTCVDFITSSYYSPGLPGSNKTEVPSLTKDPLLPSTDAPVPEPPLTETSIDTQTLTVSGMTDTLTETVITTEVPVIQSLTESATIIDGETTNVTILTESLLTYTPTVVLTVTGGLTTGVTDYGSEQTFILTETVAGGSPTLTLVETRFEGDGFLTETLTLTETDNTETLTAVLSSTDILVTETLVVTNVGDTETLTLAFTVTMRDGEQDMTLRPVVSETVSEGETQSITVTTLAPVPTIQPTVVETTLDDVTTAVTVITEQVEGPGPVSDLITTVGPDGEDTVIQDPDSPEQALTRTNTATGIDTEVITDSPDREGETTRTLTESEITTETEKESEDGRDDSSESKPEKKGEERQDEESCNSCSAFSLTNIRCSGTRNAYNRDEDGVRAYSSFTIDVSWSAPSNFTECCMGQISVFVRGLSNQQTTSLGPGGATVQGTYLNTWDSNTGLGAGYTLGVSICVNARGLSSTGPGFQSALARAAAGGSFVGPGAVAGFNSAEYDFQADAGDLAGTDFIANVADAFFEPGSYDDSLEGFDDLSGVVADADGAFERGEISAGERDRIIGDAWEEFQRENPDAIQERNRTRALQGIRSRAQLAARAAALAGGVARGLGAGLIGALATGSVDAGGGALAEGYTAAAAGAISGALGRSDNCTGCLAPVRI